MNPEKQHFEGLRRLLKLKRYEQPPPRYFNDFSSQVISRIRANHPEDRVQTFESISWEAPWLQRFLSLFEGKPLITGAFGAAVVAVLVGGAIWSENAITPDASGFAGVQAPVVVVTPASPFAVSPALVSSSTNPVSIFDKIGTPSGYPVNHTVFGR